MFQAIDNDLHSFLKSCFENNLFNRSVTIILGDHGNRIDKIRNTDVGRIEDMMPMVSVVLPPWVDKVYPEWRTALQENSRRLLSTYDLHATFQDVLMTLKNSDKIDQDVTKSKRMGDKLKRHFSGVRRGISFFKQVPKTRDCDDVGVPDWFCVCQIDEEQLADDDQRSINAAEAVINYFNKVLLNGLSECAEQKLVTIERVTLKKRKDSRKFKILLRFRTEPGSGVFEASVGVSPVNNSGDLIYDVSGDVFRINRYGSQADCLPENLRANSTILRGVCYCL